MRFRARLFAVLTASFAWSAHAAPAPAPTPAPAVAPQVRPVNNLLVATATAPRVREATPPPWTLTASDGSGLQLTRVDAKAVVEGPLAFTELHLYFHNPEARVREGTFSINLPTGAAVSRFAMETNGQLMEAEVVEKQAARRAYEDFLHRRQDPALLEKAAGNQFSARVFPIPAHADKHVVISFSQDVSPGHYTLPLVGLAAVDQLDVRVQVRGADGALIEQTMRERRWAPDRDVVIDGTRTGVPTAIAAGELVATRTKLALANAAEVPAAVTLLVDTSASRGLGFAKSARTIHQLVDQLAHDFGGALPVQVVAFDQTTAALYAGRADKVGNLEQALAARGALGASDLGQALTWLAQHAARGRVVVIGDGVVTAGADGAALGALARQLASRGVDRIDVALTGGIRDEAAAAVIARAGLAHAGAVIDLDQGVADAARRIGLAVRTEIPVRATGARWVFPRTIAAAQPGDEVTVYMRRAGAQPLALDIAGTRTAIAPVAVPLALLGRAAASAEIAELEGQLAAQTGAAADKLRAEIVRRSLAARVVSSQTSLLVLETEADYARFGIDRRALTDILTVGPAGVTSSHRTAPALLAEPVTEVHLAKTRPAKKRERAATFADDDRDRGPAPAPADKAKADEADPGAFEAEADGVEEMSVSAAGAGRAMGSAAGP
ncbi:MAG TPA: VIT domain-containing protein, partial [Kofleriaceae bacterium]|nr:VIT domain-containing protein [Kofleriaceae bacterium]